MHDIKAIRENPTAFKDGLKRRGLDFDVDALVKSDEQRRKLVTEIQAKQERRNAASKDIGKAMAQKDMALADSLKAEVSAIKDEMVALEAEERKLTEELNLTLASIPNIPHDDVPDGKDEHDNVELRLVGEKPQMNFKPKEHFELGEALGMMDFEKAAQISGARFTILKGQLARLERALGQFMLDLHTQEHGYEEHVVPLLVRDEALFGTGQLPKFEEDLFKAQTEFERLIGQALNLSDVFSTAETGYDRIKEISDFFKKKLSEKRDLGELNDEDIANYLTISDAFADQHSEVFQLLQIFEEKKSEVAKARRGSETSLWLIPTSEVPLTNLVREEILDQAALPKRFTALTPCFRSEAGSAGRDTRGMLRQHQFYKVELVSITDAETSLAEHERMTACAEEVLKRLGLHFRTVVLCTGDMGFGAKKTHDIEVWLPGQNAYREISSCSVCGDFQARRMDARYRAAGDPSTGSGRQTKFVHTLNGSGVAVGRALIAVMENYQNEDGTITVPEALRPYMGGLTRIGTPA